MMHAAAMAPTNGDSVSSVEATTSTLASNSTVSLLPLACRGNRRARAILLERMRPYLKRIGHGQLPAWARGRAETDDLVQESMIRALKHIPRFEGQSIRDFRNWLHTVFRNLVTDEKRYVQRYGVGEEIPETVKADVISPEEQAAEQEKADVFETALKTLSPADRLFIVYRLQHGYSFQELADQLGKPSADAARMTYNRALKKFRDAVKQLMSMRRKRGPDH